MKNSQANNNMESTPSELETVEALICETFSDDRLDPFGTESQEKFKKRGGYPPHGTDLFLIMDFVFHPEEWDENWEGLLEGQISRRRHKVLLAGAEPTQKERELFNDAAREKEEQYYSYYGHSGHIYLLKAPKDSSETRVDYYYGYSPASINSKSAWGRYEMSVSCRRRSKCTRFPSASTKNVGTAPQSSKN